MFYLDNQKYYIWNTINKLLHSLYINNIYTLNEGNEYELSQLRLCRTNYIKYLEDNKPTVLYKNYY